MTGDGTGFATPSNGRRWLALDVLRGLILLLLLPDLSGGFGLHRVAERAPDDPILAALARQMSHVPWTGAAVWDLVMPMFIFMVGVSMALSTARRRAEGQHEAALAFHAVTRAIALLMLGILLQSNVRTRFDEFLPFLILSIGLPIGRGLRRIRALAGKSEAYWDRRYAVLVLVIAAATMVARVNALHIEIGSQILALLGLAFVPAYLLLRLSVRLQLVAIVALVAGYAVLFIAYAPQAPWAPRAHLALAVDQAMFAALPRAQPYAGNEHDYHSLLVIPVTALLLVGALVGQWLLREGDEGRAPRTLLVMALGGLALSVPMASVVSPLLKSLWTPTWFVFSSALCVAVLAILLMIFRRDRGKVWVHPLVVLGSNSMLLYVLAFTQRWRIEKLWRPVLESPSMLRAVWQPFLTAMLVLLTLWLIAWLLDRRGMHLRI